MTCQRIPHQQQRTTRAGQSAIRRGEEVAGGMGRWLPQTSRVCRNIDSLGDELGTRVGSRHGHARSSAANGRLTWCPAESGQKSLINHSSSTYHYLIEGPLRPSYAPLERPAQVNRLTPRGVSAVTHPLHQRPERSRTPGA